MLNLPFSPAKHVAPEITKINTESVSQASFYINNIIKNKSVSVNFWALNELYSSNPDIQKYIKSICSGIGYSGDNYELLHLFLKKNRLLRGYEIVKDPNLLLLYLESLKQKKRGIFYKKNKSLFHNVKDSTFQDYVDLIIHNKLRDNLLNTRPFCLADVGLFKFLKINKGNYSKIYTLLNYWETTNNPNISLNTIKKITIIYGYYLMDKYSEVRKVSRNVNLFYVPNCSLKLEYYKWLTFTNQILGYYYEDLPLYRKYLIPLSEWLRNKKEILYAYFAYGNTLFRLGKVDIAQKEYEFVYHYPNVDLIFSYYTPLINNLAVTYLQTGNFNKYIQLQLNSLNLATNENDLKNQLSILTNLSIYYKNIGDYNLAVLYANKAQKIAKDNDLKNELVFVDLALANIYRDKEKNYLKALNFYKAADANITIAKDYNQWILVQPELARLYELENQYDKAIRIRDQILITAKSKGDNKTQLATIIDLADDYIKINKYDIANQLITKAKNFNENIMEFNTSVKESNVFAQIMIHEGKNKIAKHDLSSITKQIIQRAKNSAEIQSGHLSLQDWDIESFKMLTSLYIKSKNYKKALLFLDSIKTINRSEYSNNTLIKSNLLTEKQLILDQQLGNYISNLQSQLVTAKSNQKVTIQNKLSQAIAQKKQLESRVVKNFDDRPVNLTKIREYIGYNNAILYFSKFNNQYCLALITPNKTKFRLINFKSSKIDSIHETIKKLNNGTVNLYKLHNIYLKLFAGLHINHFHNLYVIPGGFLYQLPLGILPVDSVESPYSYGATHYLIESHSISYFTSLKDLERSYIKTKNHYKIDYAGFGIENFGSKISSLSRNKILAPLHYTELEVSKIDSLLPYNSSEKKLFLGNAATEQAFRKWVPKAKIVHLATHSEVYYENPLFSVIYLNGDKNKKTRTIDNDGTIHAYELFEMNLDNKMVMLSSCESGAGDYITGSGIIGLSRAFTYAGAKSLVLNLWPVNDQAAEKISVKFYEYLKRGYTKAEALRKAKLYFINNGNANPYLWGSYIETGDNSPLYPAYPFKLIALIVGLTFICVTISFIYFFNERITSKDSIF